MIDNFRTASEHTKKHTRPQPTIAIEPHEETAVYGIEGGVIDAYNREGHKEVERRVATIYNNFPINKERLMLIGDEGGKETFLHNVFGDVHEDLECPGYKSEMRCKCDLGEFEGIEDYKVFHRTKGNEIYKSVFASQKLTKQLIDEIELTQCTGEPITTVVMLWQDGRDRYLKMFADALPRIDVFCICYGDSTGKKRSFARRFGKGAEVWDTQSEVENEQDLPPIIQGIAHTGESTWLAGLPKVGKTWVMLCILLALLTGLPLFGDDRLTVPRKATRCIYLCPEAGRGSIKKRLKMLGLIEYLYDPITNPDGALYLQTLSKGTKIALTDPVLLELAKGADIFIDTAVRYLEGDENSSGDVKVLTENVLGLLSVGARSLWVAHHAPKGFENASTMSLQNMFRGSGEFGAALTNAYGVCTEDEKTTKIRFHCITGRDLDVFVPDMILQGRPYLSEIGNFKVVDANAKPFKGKAGTPEDPQKQLKFEFLKTCTGSAQEKVDQLNAEFGSNHDRSIISKWFPKFKGGASNV
jgi:hypothetical protein